jgi:ATP-dependent helicase/nuclease subunit B
VLDEAIGRARRDRAIDLVRPVADAPGFRRRLRGRIAAWTWAERDPGGDPPDGNPVTAEEWAIFGRYRALLNRLGAEDPEALAVWASRALHDDPPPELRRFGYVAILDPSTIGRAGWRAIEHFEDRAAAILVTLPFDPDNDRAEAFASVAPIRDRLLDRRYTETSFADESPRPAGLAGIEVELFRDDAHRRERLDDAAGLRAFGAPEGEGIALILAREVRRLLDQGAEPDEVLVLVPRWDEPAGLVLETLRSWGIPAAAEPEATLATDPTTSALRLALSIPAEGWESGRLIRLLRNGQLRPDGRESQGRAGLAACAAALRDLRVFRGRDAIRNALRRAATADEGDSRRGDRTRRAARAARAREALPAFDRLVTVLDAIDQSGPWRAQVERLRGLVGELGLEAESLDHLFLALDERGAVLDGLGRADEDLPWAEFAREVEALVRDVPASAPAAPAGVVRVATVEEAEGVRARHVLLANLAEGTFPAREALDPDPAAGPDAEADARPDLAFAREMLRFLRVVGSADDSLTLAYPTTDEKGQALLAAGFLDDVQRLFTPEAWDSCHESRRRLDPVLDADLAGAPAEARVRAVSQALAGGGDEELGLLARSPRHRPALEGAAAALRVAHRRQHRKAFGPHDGRLGDPRAIARIAADFGPDRPAFSPSQLESLAFCPFQFFLRYVLRLEPADDRDELDDDHATRGRRIHRVLETLHTRLHDVPAGDGEALTDRVVAGIDAAIGQLIEEDGRPASDVDRGLRAIEHARLIRTGRRYARQFAGYFDGEEGRAECHRFEATFGDPEQPQWPALVLGSPAEAVQLQGTIDRIDLVRAEGRTLFRVIDYKSGPCPTAGDIAAGLALQLPLYALAVERIILSGLGATPLDAGYWALRDKGYRAALKMAAPGAGDAKALERWESYRQGLEAYVLALVGRLRQAAFPVHPRSADCTRNCDYRTACRIAQVRLLGKTWPEAPRMEPAR